MSDTLPPLSRILRDAGYRYRSEIAEALASLPRRWTPDELRAAWVDQGPGATRNTWDGARQTYHAMLRHNARRRRLEALGEAFGLGPDGEPLSVGKALH